MISQPAYTEDSVNNSPCLLKTDVTDGHFQEVRKNISISFSSQASINSVVNSTGSHQDSDVLEEVNKDVELDVIMGNFLLPGDEKNQMKDKVKSIPSNIKEEEKTGVATKNNNDASEHVLEVGSGLQIIEVKEDTTDITGDKNNKLVTGEEEEEEEEEENECPSKNLSTTFNEMTLLNSKTLNDKEVSEKWLEQVEGMSPVSNKDDESCNVEAHTDLPTHKVSSDSLSVESAIVVIRDVCSLRGSLNDSVKVYEAPGIVTCHNNGNVKTVEAHSSTFNDNKEVSHGNRFYNNNILKAPVTLPSTKTEILPCVDTLKCVDNVVNIVSRIDASKDSDETPGLMLGNSPNTYKRDRSSENDEEKKTYERGIRNGICIRFEQQCLSSDEIMSCETDKGNYLAREEQPMKAMGNNDVRDSSVVPIEVDQTESKQESEESEPKADHSFPHNSDYRINEFKKVETNQTLMQSKEMTQKMLSLPVRKTGGRKSEYT
ncbi:uncharacterized protein LOC124439608 isoform X3 [Xenia sp. Carnegie-2017]|uniref:uncharacterized protein LOC124439608 isoform X3 n=1 Tax=Xenia sp. Carnegie-2017 TaxID=2897299 RepID=UPI001F03D0F5|nr:uncharacterized protein LOC124439608 isoform X3 [Xenia sp. Carnegie-2017]